MPGSRSITPTPTQSNYDNLPLGLFEASRSIYADAELLDQRQITKEANDAKFATLFEPSTPRASPNLKPSVGIGSVHHEPLDASSVSTPLSFLAGRRASLHRPRTASTASSEFGAFVEVSTDKDPLSNAFTPDVLNSVSESNAEPRDSQVHGLHNQSGPSHASSSNTLPNTTLGFFDTFTQDAKQRNSAARSHLLDELLLHQDDPMWFTVQTASTQTTETHDFEDKQTSLSTQSDLDSSHDSGTNASQTTSNSIHDIDHDYFRLPSSSSTSHERLSPNSLRRLMTLPPPSLAPPVASQLTASPPSSTPIRQAQADLETVLEFDPLVAHTKREASSERPKLAASARSSSLQTLSSVPSKLVSTLLRSATDLHDTSQTAPPLGPRRNSSQPPPTTSSSKSTSLHHASGSSSPSSSSSNLVYRHPPTAQSQSTPHFAPVEITHSTPFSTTVYLPPSGAPGFTGDRYDWDKGFSDELEVERKSRNVETKPRDQQAQQLGQVNVNPSSPGAQSSGGNFGVGNWVPGGRSGWGGGFGFGFGSMRLGKTKASPPNSVLNLGFAGSGSVDDSAGVGRRSPLPHAANVRDEDPSGHNGHDRQDTLGGMAEFIEKKLGNLELVGRKLSSTPVLTTELAAQLRAHLPALSRLSKSWNLVYSLDQHGISLKTLYSQCESYLTRKRSPGEVGLSKGMLLVLKDSAEEQDEAHRTLFGAWIADGIKANKGKGYAGGGESFLWKYTQQKLQVFKATGKNNYVALCEPGYISFGGGDGHYGLYLDDTLFEGSSAPCPTFDNEPLCFIPLETTRKTVSFECMGLEVWGMGA